MWRDDVAGWAATMTASQLVVVVILALACVGVLMWIVLDLARHGVGAHPWLSDPAEAMLAKRYARGEIDANQYWQLLGGLRRHRS
jgi:uncharacterized membrane protein